jgi:hypothetical protein
MPLLLAAALAALSSWVPIRWPSADPASLALLKDTPINAVLLAPQHWSPQFVARAAEQGIAAAGFVSGPWDDAAARAAGLAAIVSTGPVLQPSALPVYRLPDRSSMQFDNVPLAGTSQGVWSGINPLPDDHTTAAPSGGPWLDTNAGFLRFARSLTSAPIWIANSPPPGKSFPISRYLQVAAEAAMFGARWVVAFDAPFQQSLLARHPNALRDWRTFTTLLAFLEARRPQLAWPPAGKLTLLQDAPSGALLSGGILDMFAVKHTPVRPLLPSRLQPDSLRGSLMAVNVSPLSLSPAQRDALAHFSRSGGTVLSGPPDWRFPTPAPGQFLLPPAELSRLDAIWKEVNSLTGRRNLGVRLFNVASMLSNLTRSPDGARQLLHLVNYSDFPVENITVHMLGPWKKAVLHRPGLPPASLETYPTEDGTGMDIPEMAWYAILEVE